MAEAVFKAAARALRMAVATRPAERRRHAEHEGVALVVTLKGRSGTSVAGTKSVG